MTFERFLWCKNNVTFLANSFSAHSSVAISLSMSECQLLGVELWLAFGTRILNCSCRCSSSKYETFTLTVFCWHQNVGIKRWGFNFLSLLRTWLKRYDFLCVYLVLLNTLRFDCLCFCYYVTGFSYFLLDVQIVQSFNCMSGQMNLMMVFLFRDKLARGTFPRANSFTTFKYIFNFISINVMRIKTCKPKIKNVISLLR